MMSFPNVLNWFMYFSNPYLFQHGKVSFGTVEQISILDNNPLKNLISNPELLQKQSSVLNLTNSTTFSFNLYSDLVAGLDGPFVLAFLVVFFISLGSYVVQFKNMKRNQHILFWMLFSLCLASSFQNMMRLVSELAFLSPSSRVAYDANNVLKGIDRSTASLVLYIEILIMGFISYAFMHTTRASGDISKRTFNVSRVVLVVLLIAFFAMFFFGHILIVIILHILRGSFAITAPEQGQYSIALFTVPMIVFAIAVVVTTLMLNVFGFRLYISLRNRKKKIKEMMKRSTITSVNGDVSEMSVVVSDCTPASPNVSHTTLNNESTAINLKEDESTNQDVNIPTTYPQIEVSRGYVKSVKKSAIEKDQTYKMKKRALRKALSIQIGLSICFVIEFAGYCFLPGAIGWEYSLLFFHQLTNFGVLGFLILLLTIYHPLREVQRLFKAPSESSIKPGTSIKKLQASQGV